MSATTSTSGAKRFELPALNFNFSSLTEGTNIPAPPDSPVEKAPTPPKTPVATDKKVAAASNGSPAPINPHAGTKRPADDTPLSPASSSKAGSIRRLFSRNLLNNAYAEGETQSNGNGAAPSIRPMSRSNGSILDEKKSRRGSGFFRRFTGGHNASSNNNTSVNGSQRVAPTNLYQNSNGSASRPEVVRGPPPPMIPELSALESKVDVHDGGSLGSDLFKNIK
ncbi:hypothetical protein B0T11DRAFT_110497 [Plectosphaerella cucumerina]|uniref:Uncharacterized protein n=1 Tax=Plectosphaerella cucumerina TaxID=40658 RepID=A0A8K0TBQ5_9PEZI|nr:hypothetical protein B0T11DRAFT_110497 [Plectosphaerella cucumerina]